MTTQHTQDWETTFKKEDGKDEVYCYWDVCQKCKHSQPSGHAFCSNCGRRDKEIPTPPYLDIDTLITRTKAETIEERDGAYKERNALVCALSKLFPSHLARHDENDATWDKDWMWIVYIDLPTGQVSWHIHDSERDSFNHLEVKENNWDGHNTQRKYERLAALEKLNDTQK